MKWKYILLVTILLLTFYRGVSQSRVSVNIPTSEMESDYIWRTIQDINFFEENNYQISLPLGAFIEELKAKAKISELTDDDYNRLKMFVRDSVYNETDYKSGYDKIEKKLTLIEKMIKEINQSNFNWTFKEYDRYQINLTLYGPGGSYDPDEGSLLIFATPDGKFKSYDNPANTIIHEIIHIGIEESIVNKYQVPHTLKERIVDTLVFLKFKHYLPDYRIQDMGEYRLDQHMKTKADLVDLDDFVELIMQEN